MKDNLLLLHDTVPDSVAAAAHAVSGDPAFLERIQSDWPYLGMAAMADYLFGQSPIKDSDGYSKARAGLRSFLDWAGSDGRFSRGLAPYVTGGDKSTADTDRQIALDVEAVARMADVLNRCSQDNGPKKLKKRFLPLLADLVIEWHAALNLPTPALSDTSPTVKLMCAIASANHVVLMPSASRKALAIAIKEKPIPIRQGLIP